MIGFYLRLFLHYIHRYVNNVQNIIKIAKLIFYPNEMKTGNKEGGISKVAIVANEYL